MSSVDLTNSGIAVATAWAAVVVLFVIWLLLCITHVARNKTPLMCRMFGHNWRKGWPSMGGPVIYCDRCPENHYWPKSPPLKIDKKQ